MVTTGTSLLKMCIRDRNNGVSTVVLQTNKTSTTLNLTLLCDGYSANDKVVLRHIGSRACLTVKGRSRRDLLIGR